MTGKTKEIKIRYAYLFNEEKYLITRVGFNNTRKMVIQIASDGV